MSFYKQKPIPLEKSLIFNNPQIAGEWDYTKNLENYNPRNIHSNSAKKIWWKCVVCNNSWNKAVVERTRKEERRRDAGCPRCKDVNHSKEERYLRFELIQFFQVLEENTVLSIGGKKIDVDIILPDLKTVVEYDGFYFHKEKIDKDTDKTLLLASAGWFVIRIREGLEKLMPDDIAKPLRAPLKPAVNALLIFLNNKFSTGLDLTSYLAEAKLTNVDEAEKFILEQKIRKQWRAQLIDGNTDKENILKIRKKVIDLCIAEQKTFPEIAARIRSDFGIELDRLMISKNYTQAYKQITQDRPGLFVLCNMKRQRNEN